MAHSCYHAPVLQPERVVWSAARSLRSALSALLMLCVVMSEALAAQRSYARLRRKGLPDAKAIRQAFFGSER